MRTRHRHPRPRRRRPVTRLQSRRARRGRHPPRDRCSVRAIATDNTGTLTVGQPFVTDIVAAAGYTENDVLALAAAVDSASEHPLARAIVNAAATAVLTLQPANGFEAVRGFGARAVVAGSQVTVGNERLVIDHPEFAEIESALNGLTARGAPSSPSPPTTRWLA